MPRKPEAQLCQSRARRSSRAQRHTAAPSPWALPGAERAHQLCQPAPSSLPQSAPLLYQIIIILNICAAKGNALVCLINAKHLQRARSAHQSHCPLSGLCPHLYAVTPGCVCLSVNCVYTSLRSLFCVPLLSLSLCVSFFLLFLFLLSLSLSLILCCFS